MIKMCPICSTGILKEITHKAGRHYFLCEVDTSVNPANVDIGTGLPVDAWGCTNCVTIILNSSNIINK